jgi:hypothetical protein
VATQQGRFCEPSMMRVFKKGTYQEEQQFADDDEDDDDTQNENAPDITGASYGSDFDMGY